MNFEPTSDLWKYLSGSSKKIVMYGMGNGADKILAVCARYGIEISDFFASDGFVRGHSFHGKTVLSYTQVKEKYGAENIIVLLSFASSDSFFEPIGFSIALLIRSIPVFSGLYSWSLETSVPLKSSPAKS